MTERDEAIRAGKLVRVAQFCRTAFEETARAQSLTPDQRVQEAALRSIDALMHAMLELSSMGIALNCRADPANRLALSDLAELNTPDTRALLDLLQIANVIAERIDVSRGRVVPSSVALSPGELSGIDLSEAIGYIVRRLQREVHGEVGRDPQAEIDEPGND